MFWKSSLGMGRIFRLRKWPRTRRARPRFCILKVLGDLLDDGELHFVERAKTFEAARRRIEALAAGSPSQYVIYNGETGERVSIVAGGADFGTPKTELLASSSWREIEWSSRVDLVEDRVAG